MQSIRFADWQGRLYSAVCGLWNGGILNLPYRTLLLTGRTHTNRDRSTIEWNSTTAITSVLAERACKKSCRPQFRQLKMKPLSECPVTRAERCAIGTKFSTVQGRPLRSCTKIQCVCMTLGTSTILCPHDIIPIYNDTAISEPSGICNSLFCTLFPVHSGNESSVCVFGHRIKPSTPSQFRQLSTRYVIPAHLKYAEDEMHIVPLRYWPVQWKSGKRVHTLSNQANPSTSNCVEVLYWSTGFHTRTG